MAQNLFTTINASNSSPRPISGTGEIAVPFGLEGQEVILQWENGIVKNVTLPEGSQNVQLFSATFEEMLPDGSTSGIILCRKCVRDTTNPAGEICWDVPC